MKQILLTLITIATTLTTSARVADAVKWNDGWMFNLSDSTVFSEKDYADSTWRQVTVPHDWSREGHASPYLASCTGYLPGVIGWYRKHFHYTPDNNRPITKIYFEGIYNRSDIYLNGHHIGGRPNGYVSTEYDLTPWLIEGDNVIAVRVDHSRHADSRWYTGSGIYRDVWIYNKPHRHIAPWGVTYSTNIKNNKAILNTKVFLNGKANKKTNVEVCVYDMDNKLVCRQSKKAGNDTVQFSQAIDSPALWTLNNPYLYSAKVTLFNSNKEAIDCEVIPVGIRSISFDPDSGFALNGMSMKIKGVCLHHDAGVLGAAVPPSIIKQRLKALKEIGVNAIRCSHNPQAPV
ncbi:MAG: glycoside hydrolase family 2, partial [Muribaculaceae bacterium]|nr:glycoside hydrolase family 2 [Muribaculaceae bacterium]